MNSDYNKPKDNPRKKKTLRIMLYVILVLLIIYILIGVAQYILGGS